MIRAVLLLVLVLLPLPATGFDPFTRTGIDRRPDAVVPVDRPFRDEAGRTVTLRALARSRPILLAPVLHACPNICGVTLAGLAQAIRAQSFRPGRDFTVIAFGIDPAEGPVQAAAQLADLRQAFPGVTAQGFHALTGGAAEVAAVTDALGYRYAWDDDISQYAHIAAIALLTPDGRLSRWLYGLTPDPTDLRLALTEAGEGRIGGWADQLLLLCYHYDPQAGRYGPVIWTVLRIAGVGTALAGIGLIGRSLLRERRRGQGQPS
ncbi:MAG TPA: SCO family protein [Geminicoccus sp.]|uniref:SCO family protein n=1 Tax=Geminicoccus sp. TaxID=2024832 RepID=UPI002B824BDD|nr:SCO family protein [Geminicoccus sp.]HWL69537.1 SCO family protein [Geminicoccus sp.]